MAVMVSSDKFNLKWNDFQLNIKDIFKNVRKEENLFDVTLICEDEIWKAHKLVLAASSDFFRNIFRKCNLENTVIVLKSSNQSQMSLLLDFIYNGEVQVEQEKLNEFLEAASDLKLKGLSYPEQEKDPKSQVYAPYSNSSSQLLQSSSNLLQSSDIQTFPSYEELCKNQGMMIVKVVPKIDIFWLHGAGRC